MFPQSQVKTKSINYRSFSLMEIFTSHRCYWFNKVSIHTTKKKVEKIILRRNCGHYGCNQLLSVNGDFTSHRCYWFNKVGNHKTKKKVEKIKLRRNCGHYGCNQLLSVTKKKGRRVEPHDHIF